MIAILRETLTILRESAAYLLLGFALAGVLHAILLRRQGWLRPLEGSGARPVFLAALIGAPLPLCSCGVLPTGLTLMRRGASRGATASFLITAPETDIVSILLTFGLIGPVMAIARPIAALVTGIAAGLAINLVDRWSRAQAMTVLETAPPGAGGPPAVTDSCGDGCCTPIGDAPPASTASTAGAPRRGWFAEAVHFGFVEFFDDLIGRLLFGLVLGALITVLFARFDLASVTGNHVLTYATMLLFGIPLYVCASASTPIAAGLIAAGISPGAALVFLLAGPATNLASLFVLVKQFGRLVFGVYLFVIAVVAVLAGIGLDLLLRARWVPAPDLRKISDPGDGVLGWIAAAIFLVLVALSAWRRDAPTRVARLIERATGRRLSRRVVLRGGAILLVGLWLGSGLVTVQPGERGVLTAFGAATGGPVGPGLRYHLPRPFGGIDRLAVSKIRRVEIGFRSVADSTASELVPAAQDEGTLRPGTTGMHGSPTESWVLTGDENIVDLQCVVHFQVIDRPADVLRVLYQIRDPEGLVRATGRWALQEAVGSQSIDSLLTCGRTEVEREVREELMQPALDACGSGLRVVDVRLASVHAPTPVHWAFRDVAGAAEDAAQYVNLAREYSERVIREAMGDSARGVALARGDAVDRVARAAGEASSFELLNNEQRRSPAITRSRLRLEELEKVLPKLRLYVDLTGGKGQGPDVWLRRGQGFESLPFGGLAPQGSGNRETQRSQEEGK